MKFSNSIILPHHHSPITSVTSRPRSNRALKSDRLQINLQESVKPTITLNRLKSRLQKEKKSEISPEIAANVVKNYLLPLFELDVRNKQDVQRSEAFGHKRGFSSDRGTIYSELKLSDQLSNVILSLEAKLNSMDQEIKDYSQEKETLIQSNNRLELDLINTTTVIKHLKQEHMHLQRELTGVKFSISALTNQLSKYKSLYEECSLENIKINKQLQEENAINYIR